MGALAWKKEKKSIIIKSKMLYIDKVKDINLDIRRKNILTKIIVNFVFTGTPVGSRTLSKDKTINLSAASIRNIMADFEDLGLIKQPHTSAGRVPTDLGYRFYIDYIMQKESLSQHEKKSIHDAISIYSGDLDSVIGQTSKILSKYSHSIGIVLYPKISKSVFKHIKFVKLIHPKILVILVSLSGNVINKVIEIEDDLSQAELDKISNYLVEKFEGMPLISIKKKLLEMMEKDRAQYDKLLHNVIAICNKSFEEVIKLDTVFYEGASKIFEFPEFADLDKMKKLFCTLEERERLIKILTECIEGEGVQIIIGSENNSEEFRDLSIVVANYTYNDMVLGNLGIIGPTRMGYAKIISLVDYVSGIVSRAISLSNI
jgi:heat-inducible transcriptional repressor